MRFAFVGAGEVSVDTARLLIDRGHEVIIIERDRERIDLLAEDLDCSFLHGDGSKPPILREAGPEQTDVLFCLSDVDQDNIIASLVGRTLGFARVVTSIADQEYAAICRELELEDTINPTKTISRYLADMAVGIDILELSTTIKDEARFFTFVADEDHVGSIGDLDMPEGAKVVCFYRDGAFNLADESATLRRGDEVIVLTHSDNLSGLREHFPSAETHE